VIDHLSRLRVEQIVSTVVASVTKAQGQGTQWWSEQQMAGAGATRGYQRQSKHANVTRTSETQASPQCRGQNCQMGCSRASDGMGWLSKSTWALIILTLSVSRSSTTPFKSHPSVNTLWLGSIEVPFHTALRPLWRSLSSIWSVVYYFGVWKLPEALKYKVI
jgi:hypothetical protein